MTQATVMNDFPATSPLVRRTGVPQTYRAVLLERHLFPAVAESLASMLGIDIAFIAGSVVAARWDPAAFPAGSSWAVATLGINLDQKASTAFLVQPLEVGLDWGAIGLRRPPAGRERPAIARDGTVTMNEAVQQDFLAYYEVCNVLSCGMLARNWRYELGRPFHIMLEDVVPATGARFPAELASPGLVAVQGIFGYSERRLPPAKGGVPQYQHYAPLLIIVAEDLSTALFWRAIDGTESEKNAWLLKTGQWRWAKR